MGEQEKYTVLITWIHLVKQAIKVSEVIPFDLYRDLSDYKHLFYGLFFVNVTG